MIEIDGPPKAFFEDSAGNRYTYVVYAFAAKTPKECMDAYANWCEQHKNGYIVWRRRPVLEFQAEQFPDPDWGITQYIPSYYRIIWRCYVMPNTDTKWFPSIKPEGDFIPITKTD